MVSPRYSRYICLALAGAASWLGGCLGPPAPPPPSKAEAEKFITDVDSELQDLFVEAEKIAWINGSYITEDTDWLVSRSSARVMKTVRRLVDASRRFDGMQLKPESMRKLGRLRLTLSAPAPADDQARKELAEITTFLSSTYGKGKYCPQKDPKEDDCRDLGQLSKTMAESRDYDTLLDAWQGWRTIAPPMRDKYRRFTELANEGAKEIGFEDVGDLWRSRYDMAPEAFEAEQERLYQQVRPLYEQLHCYVRRKLASIYGPERVTPKGPIPAHLLGNMWAQEWSNIYDLVKPYPSQASLSVTKRLVDLGWDAKKMFETGEAFFVSLGLPKLPETFWTRSILTRPRDREMVCHASAWDMGGEGDVRVKMCTEITEEDLYTIHHELGHDYYYLMYQKLPVLFQRGAHDGFHEGIGDTLVLSATPAYLKELGLLDQVPNNPKAQINVLMKRALDKIAFLPFGRMVDQWRWEVFDGRIPSAKFTEGWWRLRTKYQGIVPPVPRNDAEHFDPGAKYHIPANTPYSRYFLAAILQFQFHRALCRVAGHKGPLHECSIFNSKAAGEKLSAMMRLGSSKPWPDALEAISGEREMDATALIEYFAPLGDFLKEANAGETCGW